MQWKLSKALFNECWRNGSLGNTHYGNTESGKKSGECGSQESLHNEVTLDSGLKDWMRLS